MGREKGGTSVCLPTDHFAQSNAATGIDGLHPHVAILLCTMQGQHYLREQLDSILSQAHASWTIWASDGVAAVSHDWWAYMVVSGCGGKVFYDIHPSVRYRQHASNILGTNLTWTARVARMRMLVQGQFRVWNDRNLQALQALCDDLTPDNQKVFHRFTLARSQSFIPRLIGLYRTGIYRQTLLGNLGLIAAAFFKKI